MTDSPIRRDTIVNQQALQRRRQTAPGIIGGAITRLMYEIAAQVEPDPAADVAWDTLTVTASHDEKRASLRLSVEVDLRDLAAPTVIHGDHQEDPDGDA